MQALTVCCYIAVVLQLLFMVLQTHMLGSLQSIVFLLTSPLTAGSTLTGGAVSKPPTPML